MDFLQAHARIVTEDFIRAEQEEIGSRPQVIRSHEKEAIVAAQLSEMASSIGRGMNKTLSELRQELQAKVYEKQMTITPGIRKTSQATVQSENQWHSEIEIVSRKLFDDGHYREAVLNSYIKVIEAVKQKSLLAEDGDSLMGRAFGCELGRFPKIRFNPCKTQADVDEQKGIMFLFKGVVGMRNFKAHSVTLLDDPQRAQEYLALSSLLMRLLDSSTVSP